MTNDHLKKQLQLFDLSPIEADIYLYLYNKQPHTVVQIAKKTSLPRTSIYDNIHRLLDKGLVERIVEYKSQSFRTHPIDILESIIDAKQIQVDSLQQAFNQLQSQMQTTSQNPAQTQVRYFHGRQGLQQMMYNALDADKEVVGYSVYGRASVVGRKFTSKWVAEFDQRKLRDMVITNPRPRTLDILKEDLKPGMHQQTLSDIRYLPESKIFISGDTSIYNNIVAICYWLDDEIVGVEIENAQFAKTQKTIFYTLWDIALPIETLLK